MHALHQPIRIVYELNSVALGGMEYHAAALAMGVQRAGFDVHMLLPSLPVLDPIASQLQDAGIEVLRNALSGQRSLGRMCHDLLARRKLLQQLGADILHQHRTGPYHGKLGCLSAAWAQVPAIIATEHQTAYPQKGMACLYRRYIDHWVARIIVVSEYDRTRQLSQAKRSARQVVTLHNGIDTERFSAADRATIVAQRQQWGLSPQDQVIGTAARLDRQKGLPFLLDAAKLLSFAHPHLIVLIAGDGPQRPELVAQAQTLGIANRVRFLGHLANPVSLLQALDVFVLPSLWEPFGLAAGEAMSCAIPVVATAVGGLQELIVAEKTGLLVPPGNAPALATAVSRVLDDRSLAASLGQAGRQRIEASFSQESMVAKTVALYRQVLAEKGYSL